MKILITGGKSATALKLIKAFGNYQVVLADYAEVPTFTSKAYSLISLGIKNEDTLAHTLLNKCLDEGIDLLLPIHHFEIEAVAKAKTLFNEFNIQLLLPSQEELDQYVVEEISKVSDWVVLKDGEIIFASNDEVRLSDINNENLSGAFHLTIGNKRVKFSLITI
ncbi:ATP-grasp domain-containing protein [Pedobacter boryungensis]|uniref:Uncharacterized protein n=1 Tax=Pedobacter boryungensis TaxID=869962 RepID=A0ABX2D912_9SPHI|nr:hypothetical protein [Pedobacter boryungensis]NQX30465.1 hypothetical protein [Pedobacter boryungensis]